MQQAKTKDHRLHGMGNMAEQMTPAILLALPLLVGKCWVGREGEGGVVPYAPTHALARPHLATTQCYKEDDTSTHCCPSLAGA
ncbi:hypothetical protein E2C01_008038 [Portunus trituberculatus]|uniref:Uncharacterized protein n=1 Tax=Portunus trituberculatus TaxID=210409 RepID=A0A5B7D214_PORTR|nr:hypothetical protein [Portunus trituberculatus]